MKPFSITAVIAVWVCLFPACSKDQQPESMMTSPEQTTQPDVSSYKSVKDRDIFCPDWSVWHKAQSNNRVLECRGTDGNPIVWDNVGLATAFQGETDQAPDLVNFGNNSYIFYRGDDSDQIYYSISENDGSGCTFLWFGDVLVPGSITATSGPSAVVFGNQLYVFTMGGDGKIYYNRSSDGVNWFANFLSIPSSVMPDYMAGREPAVAVLGGRLYVFAVRNSDDMILYTSTTNGLSWGPSRYSTGEKTKTGLSAVTSGSTIILAFTGQSSKKLYDKRATASSTPGILNFTASTHIMNAAYTPKKPDIAIASTGKLLIAFKSNSSAKIYYVTANNASSPWTGNIPIQDPLNTFPETTEGVGVLSTL